MSGGGTVRGHGDPQGGGGRRGLAVLPEDMKREAKRAVSVVAVLSGAALMVGSHVMLAVVLLLLTAVTPDQAARAEQARQIFEEEPPEVEFIPAELVKLGRQFDPRELPNRRREARTTAPTQPSKVPRHGAQRVNRPDAGPLDSVQDLVSRLGTRADELAQIAAAADQEGDPDGVAEGTATREEGDVYRTYLYGFFRRGFQMPTSIPDSERRGLRAVVQVRTSSAGRIEGYSISRPSGNADFDQAVRLRLDQAVGSMLREPPEEERDTYFGTQFPISMSPPR